MATILLTGGTGLIGKNLTDKLIGKGHSVKVLTRSSKPSSNQSDYIHWDVKAGKLDKNALKGVDSVIHLAGAGVADNAWTESYKKEIISSRVDSIGLICKKFKELGQWPEQVISASGTAYYGFENSEKVFTEEDKRGQGFLSTVSDLWEEASKGFENEGVARTVFRIGVVLSDKGGALQPLKMPFKFGIGSPMGSGKQPMPWIHIDDLTDAFVKAAEGDLKPGYYNAVAPEMLTNAEFSRTLAKKMSVPFWAPSVPSFVLRLILGKQKADEMLLNGAHVSSKKLEKSGFHFRFGKLSAALEDLL